MNILEYQEEAMSAIDSIDLEAFAKARDLLLSAIKFNKKIIFIGNGGNATTASHLACDFQKGLSDLTVVEAISLCDNIALITAWANDKSYPEIFTEQLKSVSKSGDCIVALSASGNSPNIVDAIVNSYLYSYSLITISGCDGGAVVNNCCEEEVTANLIVESDNMQVIEDVTLMLGHALFREVRTMLEIELKG